MQRLLRLSVAAVMILATSAMPSQAENVYDLTWDGTASAFFFVHPVLPYYIDQQSFDMTLPAYNFDFSSDKTFRLSLSAPAGQAIRIAAPASPPGAVAPPVNQFSVNFNSFVSIPGAMIPGTVDSIVFTGLQGPAPTVNSATFDYGSASFFPGENPQFMETVAFALTQDPLVFTSLTMTFTGPSAMTLASSGIPQVRIAASSFGFYDPSVAAPVDPGVWVSLVAVPEIDPAYSGGALAIVVVAFGMAERRIRRALAG